ncbi:MAG: SIMPL domain-containing protein [Clostridia bacterium]|nr:SIMPL domain-containing protein [Clostridia bacterium]
MKKFIVGICVLTMLGLTFFTGGNVLPTQSFADDVATEMRLVTVQGVGEITVKPDMATINIGVETQDKDAAFAQKENARIMDQVSKAIKALGITEDELQTSQYNIYKSRNYGDEKQEEYYVVSNTLTVTVNNIEQVGDVIDASSNAGANKINSIDFGVKDESKYYQEALKNAMNSAKGKATTIMATFGKKPGAPYSVVESGYYGGVVRANYAMDMVSEKSAISTPIEAGDLTITANISVQYDY